MNGHRGTRAEWTSIVDLLRSRAAAQPEAPLFAFLADGDDGAELTLSRIDLDRRARALAVRLRELGLDGGRALLLYPPGLDFIVAYFGCLYAGVVAVPAHLPRINRPMTRLQSIVVDARPSVVLTNTSQGKDALRWDESVPELRRLHRLYTDEETADTSDLADRWTDPCVESDTLAFLQYTSGSTAAPKGVRITHGNLLDNSARIQERFASTEESRGVFWLPLFHDMGLIGGVLQTLFCGGSSTLLSPVSFLQRPLRWLQAISRNQASISGGPNFAYDLCVERTTPEQRAELDLSHWRVAFNGAEPVRPETLERFARAFEPAGFRREAFLPCYGLAESTLLVAAGRSERPPVFLSVDADALGRSEIAAPRIAGQERRFAGSGEVATDHRVLVVDPATGVPCPSDRVGEIWVSGPSVAHGYWGKPAETERLFHATLSGNDHAQFLRTGDLGFLKDAELYVTGRLKDMMIVCGRNVYPQDVEWTAERAHPSLRAGGTAAFAVEIDGEEQLVVVQEVERNRDRGATDEVINALRQAVAEQHDIEVHAIQLIKPLSLPKTSSGKVQRHACREAFLAHSLDIVAEWTRSATPKPAQADVPRETDLPTEIVTGRITPGSPSQRTIMDWLAAKIAGPLGIPPAQVDVSKSLAGFGIGSLQAVRLAAELEDWLGRTLAPTLVYDYPTIEELSRFLAGETAPVSETHKRKVTAPAVRNGKHGREPIAIVGIGCRFPGAAEPEGFWKLLREGVETVGPIPASRWESEILKDQNVPERGGFLQNVDQFDADFFGISPREAVFVDPQQRLLLELAWEALEDGGQAPERLAGAPVGVFVGIATNDYAQLQAKYGGASEGYRITGSAPSIAANRISHQFDFRGPSLAIDTACSSSLVAVQLACRSLWDGESEIALAGGVNLILAPDVHASFAKAGFLSADGRCKTFDAQANGYVRGEGAGVVVLKPLSRAEADGDPIYALIRGGAINQDGRTNGLTAPSRAAQEAVLRAAYRHAGISPGEVDYVEAHGTGTLLGDPIELTALGAVLAEGRPADRSCALGSVKTNIGHLEAAAGMAGVIKTALALRHQAIPPSLHFSEPNPHVPFDKLPLRVQSALGTWPDQGRPAIAGVSSFGFGGTNAHLVMEQASTPDTARVRGTNGRKHDEVAIPLSAKSPAALWDVAHSLRNAITAPKADFEIEDLAHTAGVRRGHHEHRLVLVVSSVEEAADALNAFLRGTPHVSSIPGRKLAGRQPRPVFVFSGSGSLWPGAGRSLYKREAVFQAAVDAADSALSAQLGWSPRAAMLADPSISQTDNPAANRAVQFLLQIGLTALWKSWGIVPSASIGHGIGEIAAAFVSGTLRLDDAARLLNGPEPQSSGFSSGINALADEGFDVFLELGPHPIHAPLIRDHFRARGRSPLLLASMRRRENSVETMRWSSGFLYAAGCDLDWSRVLSAGQFVRLPAYPWQRESFWLDRQEKRRGRDENGAAGHSNGAVHANPNRNGHTNGQHSPTDSKPPLPAPSNGSNGDHSSPARKNPSTPPPIERNRDGFWTLPIDVRRQRLMEYFRDRVAAVLELAPEKVDPDRPLMSLGLDSLSAMDLKIEIDAGLGTTLPLSMLMEGSGIRELADRASEHLTASPSERNGSPTDHAASEPRLSYDQQLLWYAHQFTSTSAAYHVTGAATIHASLDLEAFRRGLRRVIAHQDSLRTVFSVVDEKPVVRLHDAEELFLRESEWLLTEDIPGRDDLEIAPRITELASAPFNLETGPLFRIHILSRSPSEHVILLVLHHIISDFWSAAVLVDDLGLAYAQERAGRAGSLPALRSRYADFTRWQHEMVEGAEGDQHWSYWQRQLAGPLPVLELPTDFARPAVQSYRGSIKHFELSAALTRAVVELGESQGTSLYTTLLAAIHVLLNRLSGQPDIIVGSPVAGRTRPHLEGLIGYFVNVLPMRGNLSGNPTFEEYLGRVRHAVAEALEHQDLPFGVLLNRLNVSPDPSRAPIFQVMYAHQKSQRLDDQGLAPFALGASGAKLNLHGLTAESIAIDKQTALFDLTIMTAMNGDQLSVSLEYSVDLFVPSTIDRIAVGIRNLLETLTADPGLRLTELSTLSQADRHQLLNDWAEPPAIPYSAGGIHERFEEQVRRSPDSVALVSGTESLTYRELNQAANQVAHRLLEQGIQPEDVVGIYVEQWLSRLAALLGILKAGGAYLPLDPEHPAERHAAMLDDSRASAIVTDSEERVRRLPDCPGSIVVLPEGGETAGSAELENPGVPVDGQNLAYVIFTSGSTGRPKGVMVNHHNLVAAAAAWQDAYRLASPPLRHLQAAGFAFDVFSGDWIRALTTGGTLVQCPKDVLLDPVALEGLIQQQRIQAIELVPALADALVAHLERNQGRLEHLRLFAVGSDTVRPSLYRRIRALVDPQARVVNSYGLTETTIDSTFFEGSPQADHGSVPIGRPFPGTRTYVLDERLEPVPVGVVGELFIAGQGVARGYAANPRQTAERFVPDPHGRPGSRMYATGDRARWRDGGILELLGRRDGQVKIRGFRVELGEVETILVRHPRVSQAAVTVVVDRGENRLAAYVVSDSSDQLTASELRHWLHEQMPDPMVPTSYRFLETLPLSANGKIDRSALPSPASPDEELEATDYIAPRTAAEEILSDIIADLLGRNRVGVFDNFFEIGIDSIIGIQLVSRARHAGVSLSPADLFRHPNIAELAEGRSNTEFLTPIDRSTAETVPFALMPEDLDLPEIDRAFAEQGGIEDLYPLTPMQEGILFHSLADPEAGHYVEQFVCRLKGELDQSVLQESWNRLVARHPALRSTIHWADSARPYQVVHRRAEHPLAVLDWQDASASEQAARLQGFLTADRKRGFQTSIPPLSRVTLIQLDPTEYELVWSIHHAVIDGWCLSILLHELLNIYESIHSGLPITLKAARPFREYVAWLRDREDASDAAYWQHALRGIDTATTLGLDRLPTGQSDLASDAVAEFTTSLPADVTSRLDAFARKHRLTLSTLIQGAWAVVLSRYSGRNDVLFGIAVSGRPAELPGVESMVGMFINSLPLRVAVSEERSLMPWLREIQSTMVDLRQFETTPLARIQGWSELPSATSLFESIVIVQNLPFAASLQDRANRLGIASARYLERTHYPLTITVLPGAELTIKISFDVARFDATSVERVLGHLRTVVESIIVDPERKLVDLPLMTQSEHDQLVGQSNDNQDDAFPDDLDLDRLSESELDALIDRLRS